MIMKLRQEVVEITVDSVFFHHQLIQLVCNRVTVLDVTVLGRCRQYW